MVDNPEKWIERLTLRANDVFIFHYEACRSGNEINDLLSKLKGKSIRCGLALNPATSVEVLETILSDLESVLLMSVEPGFSGQSFRQDVVQKIPKLVSLRQEKQLSYTIGIDGGVTAMPAGVSTIPRALS